MKLKDYYNVFLYNINNKIIKEVDEDPSDSDDDFTGFVGNFEGSKWWHKEGKLHRLDGPATINFLGDKSWWINGEEINCTSNEEFLLFIDVMRLKELM